MKGMLPQLIILTGIWRAVLLIPGGELAFNFEISRNDQKYTLTIMNGEERMVLDEVQINGDSLIARFPVYEAELRLKATGSNKLEGSFINLTRLTHAVIPLKAEAGITERYPVNNVSRINAEGRWKITFSPGTKDSAYSVGLFKQSGHKVTGTFLTTSGDYRYLEGVVSNDSLILSNFDGVFVYLFKARITNDSITGIFYSGTHHQEPFTGKKDEKAEMPDPASISRYREENKEFTFRFADADSVIYSSDDSIFKNKVVIVQILGTWCPNCLDESNYLNAYYEKNKNRGIEIVGISFEKTDEFARAAANVTRLKSRLKLTYPILIGPNRSRLKETLPRLENFAGYPTTIFLDRNHRVRKVHAGFSGPATGAEYEKFKDDFETFVSMLLSE
jgi:thiol-disulfide isomerase/thioredoxin